jgi:hypothetical protein
MAVRLNDTGYRHARELIENGRYVVDFARVHRCGVLAAENRAAQRKYFDIESAAAHLHGMLDALRIG